MPFFNPPQSTLLQVVIAMERDHFHLGFVECWRQEGSIDIILPDLGDNRAGAAAASARDWIRRFLGPKYRGKERLHGVS